MPNSICPLCGGSADFFEKAGARDFFMCPACGLIHLLPGQRLSPEEELARYRTHQNDSRDLQYRAFLNQLLEPLSKVLMPGMQGLDFGCGPGPTVSVMMRERGFLMRDYDPFFSADESVLGQKYDFITCTEAAEHFYYPGEEFERLSRLLKPGGWLGVMTRLYAMRPKLSEWYYVKDPTHVSIYTEKTAAWIAKKHGWTVSVSGANVILFQNTREIGH